MSRITASDPESKKERTNLPIPSSMRLSPRYMTKGSSPRNPLATFTAWARPRGSSWWMKVKRKPQGFGERVSRI